MKSIFLIVVLVLTGSTIFSQVDNYIEVVPIEMTYNHDIFKAPSGEEIMLFSKKDKYFVKYIKSSIVYELPDEEEKYDIEYFGIIWMKQKMYLLARKESAKIGEVIYCAYEFNEDIKSKHVISKVKFKGESEYNTLINSVKFGVSENEEYFYFMSYTSFLKEGGTALSPSNCKVFNSSFIEKTHLDLGKSLYRLTEPKIYLSNLGKMYFTFTIQGIAVVLSHNENTLFGQNFKFDKKSIIDAELVDENNEFSLMGICSKDIITGGKKDLELFVFQSKLDQDLLIGEVDFLKLNAKHLGVNQLQDIFRFPKEEQDNQTDYALLNATYPLRISAIVNNVDETKMIIMERYVRVGTLAPTFVDLTQLSSTMRLNIYVIKVSSSNSIEWVSNVSKQMYYTHRVYENCFSSAYTYSPKYRFFQTEDHIGILYNDSKFNYLNGEFSELHKKSIVKYGNDRNLSNTLIAGVMISISNGEKSMPAVICESPSRLRSGNINSLEKDGYVRYKNGIIRFFR